MDRSLPQAQGVWKIKLREDHKVCKMNGPIGTTVFQTIFTACDVVGAIVVEWHAEVLLSCSSPLPHEHYASKWTSSVFSALNTILLSACHDCCTLFSCDQQDLQARPIRCDQHEPLMIAREITWWAQTVNDTGRLWPVPGSHRPPRHQVFIPDAFASQVEAKSKHLVACAQTLFRLSGAQVEHISNLHWQGDIVFKPSSLNDSQSKTRCPFSNQGFVRVVCMNWLNCVPMVLSQPFSPTGMCNASMGEVLEVWRSRRFIYLLAVPDGAGEKLWVTPLSTEVYDRLILVSKLLKLLCNKLGAFHYFGEFSSWRQHTAYVDKCSTTRLWYSAYPEFPTVCGTQHACWG